jgi:general secretion pathway protein C
VLTLLLLYSVIHHTGRLLVSPGDDAGVTVTPGRTVATKPGPALPDMQQVASWHLFGQVTTVNNAPAPTVAPVTRMNLKLFGVIAARGNNKDARAIISGPDNNESIYGIDDGLPGGATLKEVYPDRVIILRAGAYETLNMPTEKLQEKQLQHRKE